MIQIWTRTVKTALAVSDKINIVYSSYLEANHFRSIWKTWRFMERLCELSSDTVTLFLRCLHSMLAHVYIGCASSPCLSSGPDLLHGPLFSLTSHLCTTRPVISSVQAQTLPPASALKSRPRATLNMQMRVLRQPRPTAA